MSGLSGHELDEDRTGTRRVTGACGDLCVRGRWGAVHGEEVEAASVDCCSTSAMQRFGEGRRRWRHVWVRGAGRGQSLSPW